MGKQELERQEKTLRDEFAMEALGAIISKTNYQNNFNDEAICALIARIAYKYANAMMEARK